MDDEPLTASDFFHKGVDLLRMGEFEDALSHINDAISRNYYGAEIAVVKGEILFELQRLEEALEWFNRAADLDANLKTEALLWKGRIFFEKKHYGRALSALNRVIDSMPMPGEAYLNKGMVLCERGDFLKAMESLKEARALIGDDDEKLADIYFWEGRAMAGMGRKDEAIAAFHRALHLSPEFIDVYSELGELYRASGRLAQAKDVYLQAIEEFPQDAGIRNDYGNVLRDLGMLAESLDELNMAIELDGEHSVAIYNRALTQERLSNWESALEDYQRVLDSNTLDHEARLRRLDIFSRRDRHAEAQSEYDLLPDAVRERPEVIETYARFLNRHARALECEGKILPALAVYRRLLNLHPDLLDFDNPSKHFSSSQERQEQILALLELVPADDPDADLLPLIKMLILARLGQRAAATALMDEAAKGPFASLAYVCGADMLYFDLGDPEAALETCDLALRIRSDLVKALWLKVNILSEGLGRYQEALDTYLEILKISPDNPAVLDAIAQLWLQLGQPYRALLSYRKMQEMMPVEPRVQSEIAQCYLQMGRSAEAIDELRRIASAGGGALRVRVDLVDALLRAGNLTEAAEVLSDVEEENAGLDPSIEDACLELRAALLNAQKRYEQAAAAVLRIPAEEWSPLGRYHLGVAYARQEKFAEAEQVLAPLCAEPQPVEEFVHRSLVEMAKIKREHDAIEEAVECMARALEGSPFNTRYRTLYVWLLRTKGDADFADTEEQKLAFYKELNVGRRLLMHEEFEDAADSLRMLCQDWPSEAEAYYFYSAAQCRARQYKASTAALRTAIELDGNCLERAKNDLFYEGFAFSELLE